MKSNNQVYAFQDFEQVPITFEPRFPGFEIGLLASLTNSCKSRLVLGFTRLNLRFLYLDSLSKNNKILELSTSKINPKLTFNL